MGPERFFKFPLYILHSQVYQRFLQVFLSTIIHSSIYQEIYISSPRFYIPPRRLVFSQHFYTPQPTMSNPHNQTQEIKSRMKTFNNQENLAKRMRKNQEPTYSKFPLIIY